MSHTSNRKGKRTLKLREASSSPMSFGANPEANMAMLHLCAFSGSSEVSACIAGTTNHLSSFHLSSDQKSSLQTEKTYL